MNITQVLNGIALGALYTVLAAGLALVYGLRGVMNLAHGGLYMFGAYLAYALARSANFWVALVVAPLALAVVGCLLEYFALRPLQRRSLLELALITLGLAFILENIVVRIWGRQTLSVALPSALQGSTELLGVTYPKYRLFLVAVGLGLTLVLMVWLRRSRIGLFVRAASQEGEITAMMGVDIDRVSALVVALSAAFAGVAGVLASAYLAVEPGMGSDILITSLIVVVIGGLGSIGGAVAAGMGLGMLQTIGSVQVPEVAALVPYVVLIAVLVWRPMGLAGKRVV